jgi:acylphosphatase
MKKHFNITVNGRVQGVGFRYFTLQKANELNVKGYVKNKLDRSVYIEAEADEDTLRLFLDWCHIGPQSAKVFSVLCSDSPIKDFTNFEIRT